MERGHAHRGIVLGLIDHEQIGLRRPLLKHRHDVEIDAKSTDGILALHLGEQVAPHRRQHHPHALLPGPLSHEQPHHRLAAPGGAFHDHRAGSRKLLPVNDMGPGKHFDHPSHHPPLVVPRFDGDPGEQVVNGGDIHDSHPKISFSSGQAAGCGKTTVKEYYAAPSPALPRRFARGLQRCRKRGSFTGVESLA